MYIKDSDVRSAIFRNEEKSKPSSLTDIWDRIKDWFFGTNLVEAKEHLAQLYAPEASDAERVRSYMALKELVGEGFRDRFAVKPEPFGYSLIIDYGDYLLPYCHSLTICSERYLQALSNKLVGDVLGAKDAKTEDAKGLLPHEAQLAKDLPRSAYSIDGKPIKGLMVSEDEISKDYLANLLKVFRSALEAQSPLPEPQRIAVEVLASQGVFADITQSALTNNGGIYQVEEAGNVMQGNGGELKYDLSRSGNSIVLRATRRSDWLSYEGAPPLSPMLLSPASSISMAIAPDGHVTVLSANFGSEPYEGLSN